MTAKRRKKSKSPPASALVIQELRVIGGSLRGRKITYSGDPRTRPMKDRVREATFNLVGPAVKGKYAIDLFAGTGALGLEAISRGALGVTFLEHHFQAAKIIQQNIDSLGVTAKCQVVAGDTFLWPRRPPDWQQLMKNPWLVMCSPPYDFYVNRCQQLVTLLDELHRRAPAESLFIVESDQRFDFNPLEHLGEWDVRVYPPAVIGVLDKE